MDYSPASMWFANELHDFLPLDFAWALIDPFLVLQRSQIARVCISLPQSRFDVYYLLGLYVHIGV